MKRLRDTQLTVSRVLLTIVGLVLLTAAVLGGLLATGWVGSLGDPLRSGSSLLNDDGLDLLRDGELWFQIGALALGLLLVVVGLGWLANQVPPLRRQEDEELVGLDPPPEVGGTPVAGRDVVAGGALAHALEGDLERAEVVERARVEARPEHGELRIRLDVQDGADVERVVSEVVDPAVERLTRVAELAERPLLRTDVRLVEGRSRRVA